MLAGPTVAYAAPPEDPPFGTPEGDVEARYTGPVQPRRHPGGVAAVRRRRGRPARRAAARGRRRRGRAAAVRRARLRGGRCMRVQDCNWMQLEEYLRDDDRIVLPLGSVEQHGYLSLGVDMILSERVVRRGGRAARRPGAARRCRTGSRPYFAAYPGSPTLRVETYQAVIRDLLDSLHEQGFRRFLLVNGHGGNDPGGDAGGRVERLARRRAGRLAQLVERARAPGRSSSRSTQTRATPPGWRTSRGRGSQASRSRRSASRWLTREDASRPARRRCASCSATAPSAASTSGPTTTCSASGARASRRCATLLENGWRCLTSTGRTALVTGTAHGIGAAIAAALAAARGDRARRRQGHRRRHRPRAGRRARRAHRPGRHPRQQRRRSRRPGRPPARRGARRGLAARSSTRTSRAPSSARARSSRA